MTQKETVRLPHRSYYFAFHHHIPGDVTHDGYSTLIRHLGLTADLVSYCSNAMAVLKICLYIAALASAVSACRLNPSLDFGHDSLRARTDDVVISEAEQTVFLPWDQPFSRATNYKPSILGSIFGRLFTLPVDTSSTGVMIGLPLLPNVKLTTQNPRGWEFRERSNTLFTGQFVNSYVTFYGANTSQQAISLVPILVVTNAVKCPDYDVYNDNGICPPNKIDGTYTLDLRQVINMGVGFGLNTPGSGMPYGTPSHNPFLNLVSIDGYAPSALRNGYTISTHGVSLGLTSNDTADAAWTNLEKMNADLDADPRAWELPLIAFKVNNGDQAVSAHALIDTSITQMYIQATQYIPSPNATSLDPPNTVRRVRNGTHLTFAFPDFEHGVAGYDFVVGDAGFPSQPSYVEPVTDKVGPYVNTGRNLLWGFTIFFDAVGGRFGVFCERCT
jgi:hypothetical protein